jgi:hypothetical protein
MSSEGGMRKNVGSKKITPQSGVTLETPPKKNIKKTKAA